MKVQNNLGYYQNNSKQNLKFGATAFPAGCERVIKVFQDSHPNDLEFNRTYISRRCESWKGQVVKKIQDSFEPIYKLLEESKQRLFLNPEDQKPLKFKMDTLGSISGEFIDENADDLIKLLDMNGEVNKIFKNADKLPVEKAENFEKEILAAETQIEQSNTSLETAKNAVKEANDNLVNVSKSVAARI